MSQLAFFVGTVSVWIQNADPPIRSARSERVPRPTWIQRSVPLVRPALPFCEAVQRSDRPGCDYPMVALYNTALLAYGRAILPATEDIPKPRLCVLTERKRSPASGLSHGKVV
jgi:hypothetical protein